MIYDTENIKHDYFFFSGNVLFLKLIFIQPPTSIY